MKLTPCPTMEARQPDNDDQPDGMLESDRDFIGHNREWLKWCEENNQLISAALEMLAALEAALSNCGEMAPEIQQQAREAIDKARGLRL